jgi:hypothetical protein
MMAAMLSIDINWTRDGIQFSVDNPYLVLLTVADIDTLSIENCEVKIRKVCISILVNFVVRHVSSLYRYIVGLHDKIYLYKDVLISSNFSYYDGRYAQIDV